MTTTLRNAVASTAILIGWSALIMIAGFQLRFGAYPWELTP